MLTAWIAFPAVLALIGLGWGLAVRRLAGGAVDAALVIPLGLATAIVVAGLLTAFSGTADLATPVVAVGALVGLALGWPPRRTSPWPFIAAGGVLAVYAAPIVLSGQPTFAGYLRLDDTATWLGIVDRVLSHGRSLAGLPSSTYALNLNSYIGQGGYPTGSFLLPGIGRALVGTDTAWIFQPYLALCGAALALAIDALVRPLAGSRRLAAATAFVAAQPALLYGYSLWGGIKELTAAFELALLVACAAPLLLRRDPPPWRGLLPAALAAAALMVTLGPGGAVWAAPALGAVAGRWLWRAGRPRMVRALASGVLLGALAVALSLPVLLVLARFLNADSALFAGGGGGGGASSSIVLGNLLHPLSAFQLAGIWPVGDFRNAPARFPAALLIWLVGVTAAGGAWWALRERRPGVAAYLGIALLGCVATYLAGGTPWVVGKALAIASPAALAAGLAFAADQSRARRAWLAAFAVIAAGVVWSNVLAYHDVLLAPRARLSELARIGRMVGDAGPTMLNEYEIYGDRHFLRAGAPQAPAEYRPSLIALRDGTLLTKSAWADLDSFALSSLEPFRSLVVRRSPTDSRPPSNYVLRWAGREYELWQRPARATERIVVHDALGDAGAMPWCGTAVSGAMRARCSLQPVAVADCARVRALAATAQAAGGSLLAWERAPGIFVRATQTGAPPGWPRDAASGSVTPATPGTLRARVRVARGGSYELWLGGSFARGFQVSVDGRARGRLKDQLGNIGQWVPAGRVALAAGTHEVDLRFPSADLTPGSGDARDTVLDGIALSASTQADGRMLRVAPARAQSLCGRSLDWIEVVAPATVAAAG